MCFSLRLSPGLQAPNTEVLVLSWCRLTQGEQGGTALTAQWSDVAHGEEGQLAGSPRGEPKGAKEKLAPPQLLKGALGGGAGRGRVWPWPPHSAPPHTLPADSLCVSHCHPAPSESLAQL